MIIKGNEKETLLYWEQNYLDALGNFTYICFMTIAQASFLKKIPSRVDTNVTLGMIKGDKVGPQHLQAIKDLTPFNDEKISEWLDISVKTFRSYKKP